VALLFAIVAMTLCAVFQRSTGAAKMGRQVHVGATCSPACCCWRPWPWHGTLGAPAWLFEFGVHVTAPTSCWRPGADLNEALAVLTSHAVAAPTCQPSLGWSCWIGLAGLFSSGMGSSPSAGAGAGLQRRTPGGWRFSFGDSRLPPSSSPGVVVGDAWVMLFNGRASTTIRRRAIEGNSQAR